MLQNTRGVRADAIRNPMRDAVELYFFWRDNNNQKMFVKELILETVDETKIPPESPLIIGMDTAQQLIDALWNCGLRPTEGTGSAGALVATQDHVKTLKDYGDRLLKLIEKSKA